MKVRLSWVREFVDVKASAEEIGKLMGVRGLALEGLDPFDSSSRLAQDGSLRTGNERDVVMDFDVTANRPDLLSMIGIAREIATALRDLLCAERELAEPLSPVRRQRAM